jgi:invasion protein IalB
MNKIIGLVVLGAAALIVGLAIGWAVRGLVTYNNGAETVTAYQDWRVACPPASAKAQNCEMQEEVLDSKSGTAVARISITSEKNKPELGLNLPLGVALPPGAGLVLGSDPPHLMAYRTCNTGGCIAVLDLDNKLLTAIGAAKDGKVLVAGLDGKVVAIPISFKGYGDAVRAYHGAEARRTSWMWRLVS